MIQLRAPLLASLASLAASMSCGYAAAQDADKNPWMAEVAKAAADGQCEEAKTIALRNGSLDVAERALRLCTPAVVSASAAQPLQSPPKAAATVAQRPQPPVPAKAPEPPPPLAKVADTPPQASQSVKAEVVAVEALPPAPAATPIQTIQRPDWRRMPTGNEVAKFYPKNAYKKKISGSVVISCTVNTLGRADNCLVIGEDPVGQGFGDAALKVAPLFEMTPQITNGVATSGGVVQIPLGFRVAGGPPLPDFPFPPPSASDRLLADQGDKNAQLKLGAMYYVGRGVTQDYATAAGWLRKAAEQGLPFAQTLLGFIYANGQGVAQDYAAAVSWYRKAADQGEPNALGVLKALCAAHPTTTGCPYP